MHVGGRTLTGCTAAVFRAAGGAIAAALATTATVASANTLGFPLVAAFIAFVFMLFKHVDTSHPAASQWGTLAAATLRAATISSGARIAAVAPIAAFVAVPVALEAKAGDAYQLRLHEPAVLFDVFGDAFWAANGLAAAISAVTTGTAIAAFFAAAATTTVAAA